MKLSVFLLLYTLSWSSAFAAQLPAITGRLANADPKAGELLFNQCVACHTTQSGEPHRVGPNLWNIVDRSIAGAEDFDYSDTLRGLENVWDFESLNGFLYDPASYAPGTRMVFPGIKDDTQRADLIVYLRSLSDQPVALPAATTDQASATTTDPFGDDWPKGLGREVTGYLCNACHSLAIVKQQGLSRESWDELLDWMVEEQGMAELENEQRAQVLEYLSAHFGIN